jgi:transcriptional regulator with XRE-family HTH domain
MDFGKRMAQTRKNKKLSQEAIAKAIGVHTPIIGRYERGEVVPSIEVATKIAKAIGVSLDFLTGDSDVEVDVSLLGKILELQNLDNKDKEHIIFTLDAMLRDAKARQTYAG